jgi:hypothetical protein
MRHPTFLAAIAVTLAHLAVSTATAGTIYDIVDYSGAGLQHGVVLTGSITTDGTIGVYNDASHIEGWTLTFTNGTASRTFGSTDLIALATVNNVMVDDASIHLGPGSSSLSFFVTRSDGAVDVIGWYSNQYVNVTATPISLPWNTTTDQFAGPGGLSIAQSTPEPASLTLMLTGAGVLTGAGFVRRRRQTSK